LQRAVQNTNLKTHICLVACTLLLRSYVGAAASGAAGSSSTAAYGTKRQAEDRSATATPVQLPGFTAGSSGGTGSTDEAAMGSSSAAAAGLTHATAEIEPRLTRGDVTKRRRVSTPSGRHWQDCSYAYMHGLQHIAFADFSTVFS
jgi:hypothetical protein